MTRIKEIQQEIAAQVKKETGADVEITLINSERMSVFSTVKAELQKAHSLLSMIASLVEMVAYEEDSEYCWFYSIKAA